MKLKKFGGTEQKIYDLVAPIVNGLGYLVWDVRYEKEGANWYLRIFIDSETDTISINDCEKVTTPISDMLDEKDPISQSYILEISSAGLEADLVRESHFDACIGCEVRVRGIRPFEDGSRELVGVLQDWNKETVTLAVGDTQHVLAMNALAFVKLYFDFGEA
ncbi:MAG: ribosome maturation factor RimP [Oscillospiraceae bacterium]|nr:ribosome maturation factor RimP [Oscillospiraceae bacterium]